jgi:predicted Fe-Mo cluster-binding NifX family protein
MADRAHRVVTEALVTDKGICVEGGAVTVVRVSESGGPGEVPAPNADGLSEDTRNEVKVGGKMIVAVPYLEGQVNAHFGSTRAFLLAEATDGTVERTAVYEVQGMQHNHAGIAGFLKEQGVSVILAGGMGAPMQQALKLQGFELYCGVSGPAVGAVEAFLRGEIEQSESTCGHHHGEH